MTKPIRVKVDMKRLEPTVAMLHDAAFDGIKKSAGLIKKNAAVVTPKEFGELVSSLDTEFKRVGTEMGGAVGYMADYAGIVHEMPGTLKGKPRPSGRGVYWGPKSSPKWFEKNILRRLSDIRRVFTQAVLSYVKARGIK